MNVRRFIMQDTKLLVKVIAGVLLLMIAFAFYLLKDETGDGDADIAVVPENGSGSGQTEERDTGGSLQAAGSPNGRSTDAAVKAEIMILVDVGGAVVNPSVVTLPEGSRVFEAVAKAGGLTDDADTGSINQAEILSDGQKIYIPTKKELEELQSGAQTSGFPYHPGYGQLNQSQPKLININTADSETLQQLSGVGPATAEKIINYRNENGKFRSAEEIKNVSGIGDKTFEKFKDKITV